MAHKMVLVDDFDGSELSGNAVSTRFSLDGVHYEIDLGSENRERLVSALQPFITVARKSTTASGASGNSRRRASRPRSASNARGDVAVIRAWAAANGHTVGVRGRIPDEVMEAYTAAHHS